MHLAHRGLEHLPACPPSSPHPQFPQGPARIRHVHARRTNLQDHGLQGCDEECLLSVGLPELRGEGVRQLGCQGGNESDLLQRSVTREKTTEGVGVGVGAGP
eukprot:767688-Hanusia_phi.AAC.9